MRMLAIRRRNGTMLGARPWRARVEPYVWVAPALILFFIFSLLPLIVGLGLSFVSWDGITPVRFVGIENYVAALRDSTYWSAIVHNVIYAGGTVIGKMVLGFGLALVLNQAMPGRAI